MIFLGTFLCGDIMSVPCTPTNGDNINYFMLSDGELDDFYVTTNTSYELTPECRHLWDFDTILHASFDNNTLAGNIDWSIETVSHVLIKRRKNNEFKWITLLVKPIQTREDFNVAGNDVTAPGCNEYDYAIVPVLNGIEGNYSSAHVEVKNRCIVIADKNEVWYTSLSDGYCDTTRNVPSSIQVTMDNKYPFYISNCIANYDTGTVTANFVEFNPETCEYTIEDNYRIPFQKNVMDFLTNRKPKILKNLDGRAWLIMVTGDPTDTADGDYRNRNIIFMWAEIGDVFNEEDLYECGLSDVTEAWWNR